MKATIYLDNNATTPLDPRVLLRITRVMQSDYGNPSSTTHNLGRHAADLVQEAREQVARLIGANACEIVFTSGATESCNLAIKGVAEMHGRRGSHIITCASEHKAVLEPLHRLANQGFRVTQLLPDRYGRISVEQLNHVITDETILVSIMAANNVVGTINPIAKIAKSVRQRGVLFHCDATQAVGKIPINVEQMGIDLLSFSGHKFHGPKGVGANKILMLPDEHLGRNTAMALGYDSDACVLYDPAIPNGGLQAEDVRRATFLLWKEELEYLAGRVRKLQELTKRICEEKISSMA